MSAVAHSKPGTPAWKSMPEPQASCHRLEAADVVQLLESHASLGPHSSHRSFLIVDVRGVEWGGGAVATSINLPAHTLYQTRGAVYQLCKQAGVSTIIFYCDGSSGQSQTCAGWMQDYMDALGDGSITAAVLKGGIRSWQRTYGRRMMDCYDGKFWAERSS
ncbi:hypothetical protein CDD82_3876 [Ophiocordyceps australis]|uniref:Rhodanese domain-containing protein n=1 Tax=Ophiocordyceps australis TaxID=1399860 RepID=A0A2C5ZBD4_9HYPO|nr:hypothetical protein CDD82_3876 [Ophiocordyceps australis]